MYEHGEVVPPMSPPNPHPALMEAFATMARTEHALSNLGATASTQPPTPSTATTAAAAAAAGLSGTSFLISSSRASEDGFGRSSSSLLTAHRSTLDATTPSGSTLATDLRELSLNGASSTGSAGREFEESVTSVETKRGRFKIVSDSTEVSFILVCVLAACVVCLPWPVLLSDSGVALTVLDCPRQALNAR